MVTNDILWKGIIEMNLWYEKEVMNILPDHTTMGIEEQILQLAEEKGLEKSLEKGTCGNRERTKNYNHSHHAT